MEVKVAMWKSWNVACARSKIKTVGLLELEHAILIPHAWTGHYLLYII